MVPVEELLHQLGCVIGRQTPGGSSLSNAAGRPLSDSTLWHPDGPRPVLAAMAADPDDYDYDGWIERAFAYKAALGPTREDHYEAFEDWCLQHPDCTSEAARKVWDSITTSRVGWSFIRYPPETDFDDGFVEAHPEHASSLRSKQKGKKPPILGLDDIKGLVEAADFVEDLLCDGQISVWNGAPNVGKTFLAIDLAFHVALGWNWHGREVDRGGVVYIAGEGAGGFKGRVEAFRQEHGHEATADAWFGMVPYAIKFDGEASVMGLIEAIKEETEKLGGSVRLIVVDTLSLALAGGDENSSVDMGKLVATAGCIRQATGAHVMLIHHTGKDPTKGGRGHSLLRSNVDTEVMVERDEESKVIIASVTKQRDLEYTGKISFRLRQIALGANRRGKQITNCVVEAASLPPPQLNEKSSTCLQILNDVLPEDISEW